MQEILRGCAVVWASVLALGAAPQGAEHLVRLARGGGGVDLLKIPLARAEVGGSGLCTLFHMKHGSTPRESGYLISQGGMRLFHG
jgi:hypothetical protein